MSSFFRRSVPALPLVGVFLGTTLLAAWQPPPPPPPAAEAVPAEGAQPGVEELTRGPVHEAFGRPVVFDPQPGPIVAQEPPTPVEEIPPAEKPAGENIAWIPGYWAWEDDQNQFVWVSGFWRELPPGRAWVPGYWTRTAQGSQWAGGYWSAAGAAGTPAEVEYLPEPPASLEAGPPGPAPSADQIWNPGLWIWQANRYAWRPGFWSAGQVDWVWTPAHYQWSPLGYALVPGFWDYPLWRRGLLFAPVRFTAGLRPGLIYTPRLALNTAYLGYSLFAHPQTSSYFFGDYYANNYFQAGYYPWFAFHNTRFGYDPLFAHTDWTYERQNIDWEARLREVYYDRRDHPAARPAPLYRDYVRGGAERGDMALVRPLAELRTAKDLPFKMERVEPARVREIQQHAVQVRDFGVQRARLEAERAKEIGPSVRGGAQAPVKVRLPEAPRIAAAPVGRPAVQRPIPEAPVHPVPDLSRSPAVRPPFVLTPKAPPAGLPPGALQPRTPGVLPHPAEVVHPEFQRRPVPIPPVVQPPVRPAAPVVHPPAVRIAPPPINGLPHPGHVQLPGRPKPP